MINYLKKIIKFYLKNKKKILFILPNKYYINLIKKIYIYKNKKKYGIIPNIFISKKEFIEKISNLNIINNNFYFFKILCKKYKKNIKKKDIQYIFTLLDDYNLIDSELINIKEIIQYNIDYYNISKWYPNKKYKNYNNKYLYIYKYYKYLKKKSLKKKKVYYGLALRFAVKNIKKFLKKFKNKLFIFIGNNFKNKSEKIIKKKFLETKRGKFYYTNIEKIINKKNKIKLIKTFNNINIYNLLSNILVNNYNKKIKTTIIFTETYNNDLFFKYIFFKYKNIINYNLYYNLKNLNLHYFIINIFKFKIYNKKKILYKFILDFFNNIFIKYIISKKKIDYIIYNLIKSYTDSKYIYLKKKIIKNTILLNLFKLKNNIRYFLLFLKKIINILYNKVKFNIYEKIYLDKVNKFIKNLLKIKIVNNIVNLFFLFKKFININNKISYYNFNIKNYIDIYNIEYIIKESIINFYENIIIILNNNFKLFIKKKSNFKLLIQKNKNYVNILNKLLTISKLSYIIYNKYDYNFNIINNNILLQFLINKKKIKIYNYNINNNFNIYNKKIKLNFPKNEKKFHNKRINYFKKIIGYTYTSIKYYLNNPIEFYYKYILNIKSYDNDYPKIFGIIVHKILFILYKKFININLNMNHIKELKKKVNKEIIIKKIFNIYYKSIKIYEKQYYFYNITKRLIKNIIKNDEYLILNGNNLKILSLEKKYKKNIRLDKDNIVIKGKIDRIDILNNNYRIIDYKTYLYINNRNVLIYNNEEKIDYLFNTKEYENILQLLIYSLISYKKKYKYIYSIIYLPYKIKYLKINNNIKINYDFLLKFERILYNYILKFFKKKFICNLSDF
ncbi:MAG: PD-(D/E)XK nuclease family protein [Candidatus Shikimatogenerans sp. JK-2022]|nr:PD-(D/E)XK nuclease family protein [Candidatus Shikimatogenerans bostrichidophilus]